MDIGGRENTRHGDTGLTIIALREVQTKFKFKSKFYS